MLVIKYVIAQRYARLYSLLLKFSSLILAEYGHLTNCGAKVRKKTDICKRVAIFFTIRGEKMQFCCGGGVPEYDSGIINEERERREID